MIRYSSRVSWNQNSLIASIYSSPILYHSSLFNIFPKRKASVLSFTFYFGGAFLLRKHATKARKVLKITTSGEKKCDFSGIQRRYLASLWTLETFWDWNQYNICIYIYIKIHIYIYIYIYIYIFILMDICMYKTRFELWALARARAQTYVRLHTVQKYLWCEKFILVSICT